ncbi:hypothetical protein CCP3SC5AM1_60016 [Gammaproteobacteria bacterium]
METTIDTERKQGIPKNIRVDSHLPGQRAIIYRDCLTADNYFTILFFLCALSSLFQAY